MGYLELSQFCLQLRLVKQEYFAYIDWFDFDERITNKVDIAKLLNFEIKLV